MGGGIGDGQGRHRRGPETRGRGHIQSLAHAPAGPGRTAAARLPRLAARVHRARSGLRLGQFSVLGPARAQGPGAPRAGRGRGARLSAHVPGRRSGQRQGHQGQRLRRGTGARVGVDRRNPMDAAQRIPQGARPHLDPARHYRMPRRDPHPGRQRARLAGSRRGHRQPAVSGLLTHARSPRRRLRVAALPRFISTPRVAKHRLFVWSDSRAYPDSAVIAIARDDDTTFGILHSRFHEAWSLRLGTWLGVGNDPRYTPTTTFETFPFPTGLTPDIPAAEYAEDPRAVAIAEAAQRLVTLRDRWLNPPE